MATAGIKTPTRTQTRTVLGAFILAASLGFTALQPAMAAGPADPLGSPMWEDMVEKFFGDAPYEFDPRVKVDVPSVVENQAQVPVTVDARQLGKVERVVVFADLNPVQETLTMTPVDAAPYISFRLKVEQATPVRAAVLTRDGRWHVGGQFLEAAGGGCSSPAMARGKPDWALTVGNTRGKVWRQPDGSSRLRLTIKHPMDTGLTQDNIPRFFIEQVLVRSPDGKVLARLKMHEPVSEDPTLTMIVRMPTDARQVQVDSRDIDGNRFSSEIEAGWRQSRIDDSRKAALLAR